MSDSRIILLEVPFAEKDVAKQLGARWNPILRKWYIPEGLDPAPFATWRPGEVLQSEALPEAPPLVNQSAAEDDIPGITLLAYLQQVNLALARGVPKSQWVRVEISQIKRTQGGHLQLELVEHDSLGQLTSRLPAFLWQQKAGKVLERFERETGAQLESGIKVLLQLSVDHNPTYGLRALVEDIDPSYTLGDIAKKLEAIRKSLIDAQVFHLNRSLPQPTEFTHVVVISPKDAAGLGDFREDANRLEAHGICRFTYYTAVFQGPEAAASLRAAVSQFESAEYAADALCVIRGGGSVTDLYWLNDRDLAEALCRIKIPVLTGIGHERDNTILDEVANIRFDTPSKVIGHISGTIYANTQDAIQNFLMILRLSDALLKTAESDVDRLKIEIASDIRHAITQGELGLDRIWALIRENSQEGIQASLHQLDRLMDQLRGNAGNLIHSHEIELAQLRERTLDLATLRLDEAGHEIEALAREILGVGPEATLRRGFALVRDPRGQPLTSRRNALREKRLALEFHDGVLGVVPDSPGGTDEC